MIELRGLGFIYPSASEVALAIASLDVDPGEALAITGPSGCGKTTLLRLLTGIAPTMTGGTAWGEGSVAGRRLPMAADAADLVGYMQQDPTAGVVCERVEDELAFTAENLGIDPRSIRARIDALLEQLEITHLRRRRIATLSGGERQRVHLAATLVADPPVLLLDEPTSQLDADGIERLVGLLATQRAHARTVVAVEQRPERLTEVLDRVVPLADQQPLVGVARHRRTPGAVVLEVDDLEVALEGRRVLGGIDLVLRQGEVVALTGPNGSGKTTLLRALLGFVGDRRLGGVRPPPEQIAYVPQRPEAAFCRERVDEEMASTLRARRLKTPLEQALRDAGLDTLASRSPRHLSAGERLKVALGVLTAGSPQVVLLDEPTRGLDPRARAGLVAAIERWSANASAVLIATHDEDLIGGCDRLIDLAAGGRVARSEPVAGHA